MHQSRSRAAAGESKGSSAAARTGAPVESVKKMRLLHTTTIAIAEASQARMRQHVCANLNRHVCNTQLVFDTQYSSPDQQEKGALAYARTDVSRVEQRWQSPRSYFALAMVAAQHIRIGTSNRVRCNNNLHKHSVSCTGTHDARLQCIEQIPCRRGGLGKSHLNTRDLRFLRTLRSFTIPFLSRRCEQTTATTASTGSAIVYSAVRVSGHKVAVEKAHAQELGISACCDGRTTYCPYRTASDSAVNARDLMRCICF